MSTRSPVRYQSIEPGEAFQKQLQDYYLQLDKSRRQRQAGPLAKSAQTQFSTSPEGGLVKLTRSSGVNTVEELRLPITVSVSDKLPKMARIVSYL